MGVIQQFSSSLIERIVSLLIRLPFLDIAKDIWKTMQKVLKGSSDEGMYEVLEYESTLELHDRDGEKATFSKRQKVRYLQNYIIAFEDQAWGDGKILINYQCTPGIPVDRYRIDYKTLIVISLREVKNKGDVDEFNIRWDMRNSFLKKSEQWATEIRRPIKHLDVAVVFPKERPPQKWTMFEKNSQRTISLGKNTRQQLPDGRWRVTWEKFKPRFHETYILKWEW